MIKTLLRFTMVCCFAAIMMPALAPYLGELAAVMADRPDRAVPALGLRAEVKPEPPSSPDGSRRSVVLKADQRGHFGVEAVVNGTRLPVLVDTGATSVVLRAEDAQRLGLRPMPSDYTVDISTANGGGKAARAVLNEVRIGQVTVRRVEALVMPPKVLATNLLGMTFMRRLASAEMKDGRLVLTE